MEAISRERIERVARIYASNGDASTRYTNAGLVAFNRQDVTI